MIIEKRLKIRNWMMGRRKRMNIRRKMREMIKKEIKGIWMISTGTARGIGRGRATDIEMIETGKDRQTG